MQKRMFIIVGSLLLAVGFAFLVLSSSLPPLRVAVSFGGRGTGVATFNLTNQNSRSIHLCGTYFLRQQGIEQVLSFGPNILLTNGQSHIVTIPAPTNGAPWRVVFICSRSARSLQQPGSAVAYSCNLLETLPQGGCRSEDLRSARRCHHSRPARPNHVRQPPPRDTFVPSRTQRPITIPPLRR